MKSPSRRTLLRWIGALAPAIGVAAAWEEAGQTAPAPDALDANQRNAAVFGLGAWLARNGITSEALVRQHGEAFRATGDLRASFDQDPLVEVDGFLLPVGFCRHCLAAYRDGGLT